MATLTVLIDDKLWLSSQLLEAGSCVLSGSSGSKLSLNKITTNHELLLIKGCLSILSTIGVQWTGAPARPWAYMLVVSWWSHWMHWWESWVGDGNVLRLSSSGSMHPAFTGTSECGKNSLVCSRNHDSVGWLLKKKPRSCLMQMSCVVKFWKVVCPFFPPGPYKTLSLAVPGQCEWDYLFSSSLSVLHKMGNVIDAERSIPLSYFNGES